MGRTAQREIPGQPAQSHPVPVCPAYHLVHTAPTLHFFIHYSYIIHLFQNGITTVLDLDCHSIECTDLWKNITNISRENEQKSCYAAFSLL